MPSLMSTLGVDKLPPAEQLHLAEEILDSLGQDAAPALTEAQREELRRRVAVLNANQTTVRSWPEVEARGWQGWANERVTALGVDLLTPLSSRP